MIACSTAGRAHSAAERDVLGVGTAACGRPGRRATAIAVTAAIATKPARATSACRSALLSTCTSTRKYRRSRRHSRDVFTDLHAIPHSGLTLTGAILSPPAYVEHAICSDKRCIPARRHTEDQMSIARTLPRYRTARLRSQSPPPTRISAHRPSSSASGACSTVSPPSPSAPRRRSSSSTPRPSSRPRPPSTPWRSVRATGA